MGGREGAGNYIRMRGRTYRVCAEERGLMLQTHSSRQHDVVLRENLVGKYIIYTVLMCSRRLNRSWGR